MNELENAIAATLRADALEAAMSTDTTREREILDSRLDVVDRRRRRRTWAGLLGGLVAIVAVIVGVGLIRATAPGTPAPHVYGFSSTEFGMPLSVDLPAWADSYRASPNSEKPEWVTWNRCPSGDTECIGLSFNRTETVFRSDRFAPATYPSYLAYLDGLAKVGAIEITARSTREIGGRPATVMSILPRRDVPSGVGCHADTTCEDFYEGVPGRYAVIDTASIDPDGEFLVVWTRAGAVDTAELAWLSDFDAMLAGLRFDRASASASTG